MAGRVGDGHGAALRHGEQVEPVQPGVVDDRLEVAEACLQAVVGDVPVGQPVPPLVEPHHGPVSAPLLQVVPPHR